jgi:Bacteriophage holin family
MENVFSSIPVRRVVHAERYTTRAMTAKGAAGILAVIGSYLRNVPSTVENLVVILAIFIIADTISGVWLAHYRRNHPPIGIRSEALMTGLMAKVIQYTLWVLIAAGASLMAQTWTLLIMGLGVLVAAETVSIMENIIGLEAAGGVRGKVFSDMALAFSRLLGVHGADIIIPGSLELKEQDKKNSGNSSGAP